MSVNLLGKPPTSDQLAAAKGKTVRALRASRRRHYLVLVGIGLAFIGLVAGAAHFDEPIGWAGAIVVGAWFVVAKWRGVPPLESGLEEWDFEPLSDTFHIGRVLKACQVDPRVDVYRRAVAKQRRELTRLEGREFGRWLDFGFRDDQRHAAMRSTASLASGGEGEGAGLERAGGPFTGREPETERP